MQDNPRAQAPKKERPFLPRLKDGGILARRGEYDPFNPAKLPGKGKYLYDETLDAIETLIENAWMLRRTSSFPTVIKNIERLENLFKYLGIYTYKQSKQDIRYNKLYAQVLRLKGMIYVEERKETQAHDTFNTMYQIAEEINDPVALALACMGIGTGYSRAGNHKEAIRHLEIARDYTFETSRQLSGLVTSYLARSYAKDGDSYKFERTVDTSYRIAMNLGVAYGDGTDFCIHTVSDILEEKTNGYIELGLGKKTIDVKEEIERQIKEDNNYYLNAWIPLDYAQAYLIMNEVEASMASLYDFYDRMTKQLQSPLALTKVNTHILKINKKGYSDVKAVKEFKERLHAQ
jgi:tetratricopeptide (TPR) repeat protein